MDKKSTDTKVVIGSRSLSFRKEVTEMSYKDFQKFWEGSDFVKRTGKSAEYAAKTLKITVPASK